MRSASQISRYCLALLAMVGAAILSACGGSPVTQPTMYSSAGQQMSGMPMPQGTSQATDRPTPVATNAVAIRNFAFSPATITVRAGRTVTWTNNDQDAHVVVATTPGSPFHSPTLNTGASYRFTFTTPGRYNYLCTIHPFMTGTVVVTR